MNVFISAYKFMYQIIIQGSTCHFQTIIIIIIIFIFIIIIIIINA